MDKTHRSDYQIPEHETILDQKGNEPYPKEIHNEAGTQPLAVKNQIWDTIVGYHKDIRGQSYKTFYTSGRCKIKYLNC